MTASTAKSAPCLGFLTVVESPEGGMVGGYLLLNAAGRPLEFHCTAPLRPTRTQEILYGPTLRPFLYGEQIAPALLARSQRTPIVICTDQPPVLDARPLAPAPLVLVLADATAPVTQGAATLETFSLAQCRLATAPGFASDAQAVLSAWPVQADQLDLVEPFVRIREALEEAQRAGRAAA